MKKPIITGALLLFVGVSILLAVADVGGWRKVETTTETPGTSSTALGIVDNRSDGLTAIFFHARHRCATCETIESLARNALNGEIENGNIGWAVADYTTEENHAVVEKCKVLASTVVLVELKDGEIFRWKNLEQVWDYTSDPKAFEAYINDSWSEFKNAG